MTDLTRRSIMKALTAVAGIGTQAGAAIAGAAVKAASSASVNSSVTSPLDFANGTALASAGDPFAGPARAALTILESRAYRSPLTNLAQVRPSINCFQSASPVNKVRWEQAAADADALQRSVYETAMRLIREGKVPLL